MEQDALLLAELADLLDRLERADLIVGRHDADQDGLIGHRLGDLLGGHLAVLVDRQKGDLVAVALEPLARVDDGLVLGHLGDDVVPLLFVHRRDALDGEIVALGGAAGEDNLLGAGAD